MSNTVVEDIKTNDSNVKLFTESLKVSRKDGKPPKYKDPETLIERIKEYFTYCVEYDKKITITGLALFLGFSTRQSIYDYASKTRTETGRETKTNKFSYIIKKVLLFIEQDYEQSMRKTGRTTDIFALKNFGWKDETSTVLKGDINNPIGLIAMPQKKESIEWQEDRSKK